VDKEKQAKERADEENTKLRRRVATERGTKAVWPSRVDGKEVEIANWLVGPQGCSWKGRTPSGEVEARVSEKKVVWKWGSLRLSPGPVEGVVHDHNSMWMAKWSTAHQQRKYVWLHESSQHPAGKGTRRNYDNARSRDEPAKDPGQDPQGPDSKDEAARQSRRSLLIDTLGCVENEKDEHEADTVGASTWS